MKNSLFLFFMLLFSVAGYTQNTKDTASYDPKAKQILDKVSKLATSYSTLQVTFNYVMENSAEKIKENFAGQAFLKGSKYKLVLPGNEIFSDGKTVWSYLKDAEEINITDFDPNDESVLNPSKLFTLYNKGFKYKYKGEAKEKVKRIVNNKNTTVTRTIYTVDLFPEKAQKAKYHTVRLSIDKADSQIIKVKYLGKNGTNYTIEFFEYKPNALLKDNIFTYEKARYPNATLNDMR